RGRAGRARRTASSPASSGLGGRGGTKEARSAPSRSALRERHIMPWRYEEKIIGKLGTTGVDLIGRYLIDDDRGVSIQGGPGAEGWHFVFKGSGHFLQVHGRLL